MTAPEPDSREIARRSKSNLAFALSTLSRTRKRDMVSFYAFCRVIDDIADEPTAPVEQRRLELEEWKNGLLHGFKNPTPLQAETFALTQRYPIPPSLMAEIVDGVAADLDVQRHETYEDLLAYCYKVACVVGLVSIEIFGYANPLSKEYAVALGYALQLTNIIRDVGEDAENGRIYLPLEDLRKFGVTEEQIFNGEYTDNFRALMQYEHDRAREFYVKADQLLPKEDRRPMMAAMMMGQVYSEILEKIRQSRFQVFGKRIGLSKARKIMILVSYTCRGFFGAA